VNPGGQSGIKARSQNEDDESSTTGQSSYGNNEGGQSRSSSNDNANNDGWRDNRMGRRGPNWENDNDRDLGDRRMGRMWHHRMMMGMMRPQGARFSFSSGDARMNVLCPSNESLQDCVQAAGQLLDKVSRLRNNSAASSTSAGSSSGPNTTIPGVGSTPQTTGPTGH